MKSTPKGLTMLRMEWAMWPISTLDEMALGTIG
jgi:hypothetical protein